MQQTLFLLGLVAFALYQTWRDRSLRSLCRRVRLLEDREDEIAAKLTELIRTSNKHADGLAACQRVVNGMEETRLEMERILPPMRRALAYFDQFNKTY